MLQIIDQRWREHLAEMDYLREGINLRAMGQQDPLVAWQREGFAMFGQLMDAIDDDYLRYVLHVEALAGPGTRARPGAGRLRGGRRPGRRHPGRWARSGSPTPAPCPTPSPPSAGQGNGRAPATARPAQRQTRRPAAGPPSRRAAPGAPTRSSGATTRAGAGAGRSTSSAMAPPEAAGAGGHRDLGAELDALLGPARRGRGATSGSTRCGTVAPSSRRRPPARTCGTTRTGPAPSRPSSAG